MPFGIEVHFIGVAGEKGDKGKVGLSTTMRPFFHLFCEDIAVACLFLPCGHGDWSSADDGRDEWKA